MISLAMWILWVHILAAAGWVGGAATQLLAILPAGEPGAARRTHFFTSRAMELLVVTGVLNILLRGIAHSASFSRAFFAMLSVKMVLLVCMAGVQIWMGLAWRRADPSTLPGRLRLGLGLQILLGAVAILLGLGLRSV